MCGARWRTANTRRQCDFTFSFLTRKQLCCDFAGGQSDPTLQKLSKQTLKFSPAFFKRRRNPKALPLVALRTGRNSFLQGSAGGEAKQSGRLFCRGEPSPGVPRCRRAHRIRAGSLRVFYLFRPTSALQMFCGQGQALSLRTICNSPCPKQQNAPFPLSCGKGAFLLILECRGFSAVCRSRPSNLHRSECSRSLCRP